ncbi:MAG: OmpA family protein [Bacteroidales bacterium]|nr:OmpA family protein [Bacteroidales bacterium]
MTGKALKRIISFFAALYFFFNVTAQIWSSDEYIYNEAEDYIISEEYTEALPLFQMLEKKGYNNANIKYKIGECLINIPGHKLESLPYLKDASNKCSKTYQEGLLNQSVAPLKALLYLGVAYRLDNNFDKALETFQILKDSLGEVAEFETIVDFHIKRIENAKEIVKSPVEFTESRLPDFINNKFSNFSPLVSSDLSRIFYMTQYQFYDAVMESYKINNEWNETINLTPEIKSDGDYYIVGISKNGEKILLNSFNSFTSGDIYITEFIDNVWTKLHKLNDNINTRYNETHASLSPDGRTLYFTSNQPGGFGGQDIYSSQLGKDGEWQPAKNLGPEINTAYNDIAPFVTDDGNSLFFCSQGHYNMGGYDIFHSRTGENGNWLYPLNVGYPLSTTDDDIWYFPVDSITGYYSRYSDKGETGMDIYSARIIAFSNPARFLVKGDLKTEDEATISNTRLNIVDVLNNKKFGEIVPEDNGTFSYKLPSGKYLFQLQSENFEPFEKTINLPKYLPEEEILFTAQLKTKIIAEKDTFYIENILFAFDSYIIDGESKSFLDSLIMLLNQYPELTIEITGHTDALGSAAYNQILSLRRARVVSDYLVDNKIGNERITVKGMGESQPVAVNKNSDGTDNPVGRRFNRRAEIIVKNEYDTLIILKSLFIPDSLIIPRD